MASTERHRESSWLRLSFQVSSWLVIPGAIVAASFMAGAMVGRWWDFCAVTSGTIFFVPLVLLGWLQFSGFYLRRRSSLVGANVLLFSAGAFFFLPIVSIPLELLTEGSFPPFWLIAIFAVPSAGCLIVGGINLAWLRSAPAEFWHNSQDIRGSTKVTLQYTMRGLFLAMSLICLSLAMATYAYRSEYPRVAEHVETDQPPFGIPKGAKDISWEQFGRGGIKFEFTIEEDEFRRWATERMEPRYSSSSPLKVDEEHIILGGNFSAAGTPVDFSYGVQISIDHRSGIERAIYDRTLKRAYYESFSD